MLEFDQLVKDFTELGVQKGDLLFVHSGYRALGPVKGGPLTVINALKTVLGSEGTLVMPAFNFDFCNEFNSTGKGTFDMKRSISQMGMLSEIFRRLPESIRAPLPIYSYSAQGKLAKDITTITDKHVFGADSIWGKLHKQNGKIMLLGISFRESLTFAHYIEHSVGIDYRYLKIFKGIVINDGKEEVINVEMDVRDLKKHLATNADPIGAIYESRGIIRKRKIGESFTRLMNVKEIFDIGVEELKKNPLILTEYTE